MGKQKGSVSINEVIEVNGEKRDSPSQTALGVKHKRRRAVPKIANVEFVQDRLSELPDEILSSIISAMPLREAARTRILSSRWRYLRRSFNPNLYLDSYSMHGHNYGCDEKYTDKLIERGEREKRRCSFVKSVNQFLQFHAADTIKTFGVCFYLNKEDSNDLDQWIKYAITAGAEKLQLDFTYIDDRHADDKCYTFPFQFLHCSKESSLKHLKLVFCILRCHDFEGFSSLTTLNLKCVKIGDVDIVNLLSKCPHLEWLSVESCKHLVNLKIVGPSLQLKYLKVDSSCRCKLMKIEIHAEHLRTFEYWGREITFSLRRIPRLVNVLISFKGIAMTDGMISPFSRLPSCLSPQIESLALTTYMEAFNPEIVPQTLSRLTNLKHLLLEVDTENEDLLQLTSILKGCPHLQKFQVHMIYLGFEEYKAPAKIRRRPICPHNYLKEVELSNFYGKKGEVELAACILNNAMALESMIIDPREKNYLGDGRWEIMEESASKIWFPKIRARVVRLLNQEVPPSVKLVIL
ncbi:putative F-box/LRR-repeat protein At5g54820 isoform X2 [Tasmannia lanceolata]|uniref:putative F-box/LRR-repeat protein At5g54820 isoform X2 n=1 Tax=Tasmannia lanceolata TaxID=3420 RepID=UPI0040645224